MKKRLNSRLRNIIIIICICSIPFITYKVHISRVNNQAEKKLQYQMIKAEKLFLEKIELFEKFATAFMDLNKYTENLSIEEGIIKSHGREIKELKLTIEAQKKVIDLKNAIEPLQEMIEGVYSYNEVATKGVTVNQLMCVKVWSEWERGSLKVNIVYTEDDLEKNKLLRRVINNWYVEGIFLWPF